MTLVPSGCLGVSADAAPPRSAQRRHEIRHIAGVSIIAVIGSERWRTGGLLFFCCRFHAPPPRNPRGRSGSACVCSCFPGESANRRRNREKLAAYASEFKPKQHPFGPAFHRASDALHAALSVSLGDFVMWSLRKKLEIPSPEHCLPGRRSACRSPSNTSSTATRSKARILKGSRKRCSGSAVSGAPSAISGRRRACRRPRSAMPAARRRTPAMRKCAAA